MYVCRVWETEVEVMERFASYNVHCICGKAAMGDACIVFIALWGCHTSIRVNPGPLECIISLTVSVTESLARRDKPPLSLMDPC